MKKACLPLKLESRLALPAGFRQRLLPFTAQLKTTEFVENLIQVNGVFGQIADDLDAYLATKRIWAYHCTKEAAPGFFQDNGLRLTNLAQHQAEFLATHGHLFTAQEVAELQRGWHDHFVKGSQVVIRQNRIYACLSRPSVISDGTSPFHKFFGGEVIYFPHCHHPTIGPKIASIGSPVVVEFAVDGSKLQCGYRMSYYVLSRYHRSLKRSARLFESEANFGTAVPPSDIVQVTPADQFKP